MLLERLKSALPIIIVICLCFFLPLAYGRLVFIVVSAAMLCLGCHETFELLNPPQKQGFKAVASIYGFSLILLACLPVYLCPDNPLALIYHVLLDPILMILAMLAAFCVCFRKSPDKNNVNGTLASIGATVFIPWSLSFIPRLFFFNDGASSNPRPLLFFLILVTKLADTGAFAAGSSTARRPGGNHKLAPLVSPKKSWEGLLGGTVTSTVAALLCYFAFPATVSLGQFKVFNLLDTVIIGILASVIGLLGDLAESAIKRAANAKDSGSLPGIGGILDTLDSLVFVSPLFYAYVLLKLMAK